ncbi:programmed cell death protein 2 [Cydia fagiglandana]|uniref:programmed cell death protein 2 n=1 Tax=Cydia fagiglandana TaxID=1458189 RepID=UPI002FEE3600
MSANKVDIGTLEKKSSWLLHPRFFPSKIGGKPAWLDLENIPHPKDLTCKKCGDPLVMICQVYAPYEESDDGFHRTIFVFICKNGSCCQINSSENLVAFRCQLPRRNKFYSYEPYKVDENEVFPMDKWPKLCELCGVRAPSHCSKCKKTYYCSRKHQVIDWQNGHKQLCPTLQTEEVPDNYFTVTEAGKNNLYKEWELIVDEEDEETPTDVDENREMAKLNEMIKEKKAGTLSNVSESELEQYAGRAVPDDKVFNKFNKRVARHPEQVLRYDRGGTPLWITGNAENCITQVENCEYCNGERQFEFQIMPQLLNFINVGLDINSVDWGVLVVYTCKASCNKGPAYKKEFIIKQDITS